MPLPVSLALENLKFGYNVANISHCRIGILAALTYENEAFLSLIDSVPENEIVGLIGLPTCQWMVLPIHELEWGFPRPSQIRLHPKENKSKRLEHMAVDSQGWIQKLYFRSFDRSVTQIQRTYLEGALEESLLGKREKSEGIHEIVRSYHTGEPDKVTPLKCSACSLESSPMGNNHPWLHCTNCGKFFHEYCCFNQEHVDKFSCCTKTGDTKSEQSNPNKLEDCGPWNWTL